MRPKSRLPARPVCGCARPSTTRPAGRGRRDGPEKPARSRRALSGGTRIWLVFTLLLILLGVSTALWPGTPPGAQQSPHRGFDLQAHRGARGLMPENTLPAFEKALALGVTTLELRSEEHTSELQSLMRISYAVFCLKKKKEI